MALKRSTVLGTFLNRLNTVFSFGICGRIKSSSENPAGDKVHEHLEGDNIHKNMTVLWSALPEDILGEILDKTDSCRDYLNFIAVCKLWRSVTETMNSHLPYNLSRYHFLSRKNPLPMLLQPCGEGEHYMYSIMEQKIYDGLHIPEITNKWIPGTGYGWLVTIDINDLQINLINPINREQISLPPMNAFPMPYSYDHCAYGNLNEFRYVSRFFISSDPLVDKGNCLIFAFVACNRTMCYCRIGDDSWTKFQPSIYGFDDMIMYKNVLYAINFAGILFSIETNPSVKVTIAAKILSYYNAHYLVESDGNLLLVVRILERFRTKKFYVYKLVDSQIDYHGDNQTTDRVYQTEDRVDHFQEDIIKTTWNEMKSLDEQIFFIGYNGCLSRDPSLYPRMKKNCIYFADNSMTIDGSRAEGIYEEPHDIGVYDMESGEIKFLIGLRESSSRMPAIWLSPNPW